MFTTLMKTVILLLALVSLRAQAGAILMYHHVSDSTPAATSVTPAQFQEHLDRLASEGFRVVPLGQLLKRVRDDRPHEDMVAITFDDGYASVARHALPALEARGWRAAIFVTLDQIGQSATMMSVDDLKAARARGHLVLNHGLHHRHMVRYPLQDMVRDIGHAQLQLERLFDSPRWLAWPYGESTPALREALARHDYLAFGQHTGPVHGQMDWQDIPRIAVNRNYAQWDSLENKLRARPLPATVLAPASPVTDQRRPQLTLRLPGDLRQRLSCFVDGVPVAHQDGPEQGSLTLQAPQPLAPGRHRYTCTAPSGEDRFYWFTWVWLVRDDGQWYPEP